MSEYKTRGIQLIASGDNAAQIGFEEKFADFELGTMVLDAR